MKTQFGSVSIVGQDNVELKEYGVRISDDGKQIRCSIEATAGSRYTIKAQTLKYFKASIHVFIDGLWQEGRILTGGLEGTILGRTVGQVFIFNLESISTIYIQ